MFVVIFKSSSMTKTYLSATQKPSVCRLYVWPFRCPSEFVSQCGQRWGFSGIHVAASDAASRLILCSTVALSPPPPQNGLIFVARRCHNDSPEFTAAGVHMCTCWSIISLPYPQ